MTDALLFLHLLSAAALFAGIVAFTAIVLGARPERGAVRAFVATYSVGLVGLLVFGIALAIDIDGYEIWSGWVLIAIGLWLAAGATGEKVYKAYLEDGEQGAAIPNSAARAHWIHIAIVLLLLADMVGKPWA
jgi:hypothetical protein